jgi:hypothetical protein
LYAYWNAFGFRGGEGAKDSNPLQYVHTLLMRADGLTKPLDGEDFDFFFRMALGEGKESTDGCWKNKNNITQ